MNFHRIWFPYLVKRKYFTGTCHFETDQPQAMISHEFREITQEELQAEVDKARARTSN